MITRDIKIKICQLEVLQELIEITVNNNNSWKKEQEKKIEEKEKLRRKMIYSENNEEIEKLAIQKKILSEEINNIQIKIEARQKMLKELRELV